MVSKCGLSIFEIRISFSLIDTSTAGLQHAINNKNVSCHVHVTVYEWHCKCTDRTL